jgi:hypothetical protein
MQGELKFTTQHTGSTLRKNMDGVWYLHVRYDTILRTHRQTRDKIMVKKNEQKSKERNTLLLI